MRLLWLLVLMLAGSAAMGRDAGTLMAESDSRLRAPAEALHYRMELLAEGDVVHSRELVRKEMQLEGKYSTLVRFTEPAAVRNGGLLIEDRGEPVNRIWSYIPATRALRQLSGSQKRNWFMGTEFTYEDFEDYKLDAYAFSMLEPVAPCLHWSRCLVVRAVPAVRDEVDASGYSAKHYYLEEETLFPVRIDYVGSEGEPIKRLVTDELRRCGDYVRARIQTMKNLQANRETRLELLGCDTDPDLKAGEFSLRSLRTPAY